MTAPMKWIKATPDEPVTDVAKRSLRQRLRPVQRYLTLAAEKPEEDIEHVHQLRVWSRRAEAALEMYGEFLPAWRATWVDKQLKRIRDATNDARDDDVLVERLTADQSAPGASGLLERVKSHRLEAQQQVLKVYERLTRKDRLARRIAKLIKRVRLRKKNKGKKLQFAKWAAAKLQSIMCEFHEVGRADLSVNEKLHEFRIDAKKLRYAMELLSSAFPDEFRNDLYPVLTELQDKLGEINDHAAAQTRIQHWLAEDDKKQELEYLQNLLEGEQNQLEEKRTTFFAWWTPERVEQLQVAFDRIINP